MPVVFIIMGRQWFAKGKPIEVGVSLYDASGLLWDASGLDKVPLDD